MRRLLSISRRHPVTRRLCWRRLEPDEKLSGSLYKPVIEFSGLTTTPCFSISRTADDYRLTIRFPLAASFDWAPVTLGIIAVLKVMAVISVTRQPEVQSMARAR